MHYSYTLDPRGTPRGICATKPRHSAVVIPDDVIPRLKAGIETVIASEAIILEPARAPGFDLDTLLDAWARFEAART